MVVRNAVSVEKTKSLKLDKSEEIFTAAKVTD
jgi:hypothetical protein